MKPVTLFLIICDKSVSEFSECSIFFANTPIQTWLGLPRYLQTSCESPPHLVILDDCKGQPLIANNVVQN